MDDVVFLCDWNLENVRKILRILRCFFLTSSLRINLAKCKLIGVGVLNHRVDVAATMIGCASIRLPFIPLGQFTGQNMSKIDVWSLVFERFKSKLSSWKDKMLSIKGRLTLFKAELGSIGNYCMSIFPVPMVVIKLLESLRAFFGGNDPRDRKLH